MKGGGGRRERREERKEGTFVVKYNVNVYCWSG